MCLFIISTIYRFHMKKFIKSLGIVHTWRQLKLQKFQFEYRTVLDLVICERPLNNFCTTNHINGRNEYSLFLYVAYLNMMEISHAENILFGIFCIDSSPSSDIDDMMMLLMTTMMKNLFSYFLFIFFRRKRHFR